MDRAKAIARIKKCLAMASSNSEHEAAVAMRQAKALMDQFRLTEEDIEAAGIEEVELRAKSAAHPGQWQTKLAHVVAKAFGVRWLWRNRKVLLSDGGVRSRDGRFVFVGRSPATDVSLYAMQVLLKKAYQARSAYIESALARVSKRKERLRRADLYCAAWVFGVEQHVNEFAQPCRDAAAIEAYLAIQYPGIGEDCLPQRKSDRDGRELSSRDHRDLMAGLLASRDVKILNGVSVKTQSPALKSSPRLLRS